MYVFMYVCVYVCMYVFMYMYVCMYVCMYVYMYICMYVCECMFICLYVYVCVYAYMYVSNIFSINITYFQGEIRIFNISDINTNQKLFTLGEGKVVAFDMLDPGSDILVVSG